MTNKLSRWTAALTIKRFMTIYDIFTYFYNNLGQLYNISKFYDILWFYDSVGALYL